MDTDNEKFIYYSSLMASLEGQKKEDVARKKWARTKKKWILKNLKIYLCSGNVHLNVSINDKGFYKRKSI